MENSKIFLCGPCDNQSFYRAWIKRDPLLEKLIVKNMGLSPLIDLSNALVPTVVHMLTYGRDLAANEGVPNTSKVLAITMAELLRPFLEADIYANAKESRIELIKAVRALCCYGHLRNITRANAQSYAVYVRKLSNKRVRADTPDLGIWSENDWDIPVDANPQQAMRVLLHMCENTGFLFKLSGLDLIAHITVAVAKRGTVSTVFIHKLREGIRADLNKDIILKEDSIKIFYTHFGMHITDKTVEDIMSTMATLIPTDALRLMLTIQRTVGGGLTAYSVIGEAILTFPDFAWTKIASFIPNEWTNYTLAMEAVGNNRYYGYRKDLGPAKSTNFKTFSYVAKELLIKISGKKALGKYAGWTRCPQNKNLIDELVEGYKNHRGQGILLDPIENIPTCYKVLIDAVQKNKLFFKRDEEVSDVPLASTPVEELLPVKLKCSEIDVSLDTGTTAKEPNPDFVMRGIESIQEKLDYLTRRMDEIAEQLKAKSSSTTEIFL